MLLSMRSPQWTRKAALWWKSNDAKMSRAVYHLWSTIHIMSLSKLPVAMAGTFLHKRWPEMLPQWIMYAGLWVKIRCHSKVHFWCDWNQNNETANKAMRQPFQTAYHSINLINFRNTSWRSIAWWTECSQQIRTNVVLKGFLISIKIAYHLGWLQLRILLQNFVSFPAVRKQIFF